jgi:hypothetical protein
MPSAKLYAMLDELIREPRAMPAEPAHAFDLTSHWVVPATIDEVSDILAEAERLPAWWGAVYLAADVVEPGDEHGIGRVVRFHSRGWLRYTLRWTARVVESDRPHGWAIEATGDLVGRGRWTLCQDGPDADITYHWCVRAERPLLRRLSPLLAPAFAANHRWAMARGLEGLKRELARRRSGPGAS